jgi:hypothetical protein
MSNLLRVALCAPRILKRMNALFTTDVTTITTRGSAVGVATGYGLEEREVGV